MRKIAPYIVAIFLLAAGCSTQNSSTNSQNSVCAQIALKSDDAYVQAYNQVSSPEKTFTGILNPNPQQNGASTLMRYSAYNIDNVNLYSKADLNTYIGKKVVVVGKLNKFELEGQNITEIWPSTICVQN